MSPGLHLYGLRAAPFTEKVVRGLRLKRLAFELHEPQTPEDYRRWNPETGLLPLLDLDGERVHDSTAILLRLDRSIAEDPALAPHVALVSLSFDPERDTPEKLARYRELQRPKSDWRFAAARVRNASTGSTWRNPCCSR